MDKKKRDKSGYIQVAIGGKGSKEEKEFLEATCMRLKQKPSWVVAQALRLLMKHGIKLES